MKTKQKMMLLLVFLLVTTSMQSQTAILATGGSASGSGGSASYSVGQVLYTTITGTNGSVAQGAQQPYEISVVTGIEEAKQINLTASAYPNPVTDIVTLKVTSTALSNRSLSYQLLDSNGKLLENKKITVNQTGIAMSNLAPAIYFLKVVETSNTWSKQEIKTFKIIKK